MKKLKLPILVVVVVAMAAAFAAFSAVTASATTLTSPEGTTLKVGTTITAEAEGTLTWHALPGDFKCTESKISGQTSNTGGPNERVKALVETFTTGGCNGTAVVIKKGTLEFRGKAGSTNGDGTVIWSGTELTTEFLSEVGNTHCIFTTSETVIGTLTGSKTTGGNATLDLEGELNRSGGRSGLFCGGPKVKWTGSYKLTAPSSLNIDGEEPLLTGEAPTGTVGETATVTWKNTGSGSATINDETNSNETVIETTGSSCGTITAGGSCTNRKFKCLKAGEATLTVRDTTANAEGKVTVKCDEPPMLVGEVPTGTVGQTYTVTWKNTGGSSLTVEDETDSNATVAETVGSGCGTIAAGGSCTSRKVKCLKKGEATLTAVDTPSIEGKVTVKCDEPPVLVGEVPTGIVGESVTVTWKNTGESTATISDETNGAETVAETTGTACGTITAGSSCTSRKVQCLKVGEATLTIRDTTLSPEVKGEVTIKCDAYPLTGEAPTGVVGETTTVTWKNNGGISVTFDDETVSDPTVVETTGTACGTLAASGSCTSRKIKCLKKGEATITVKDTPLIESNFTVKCDNILEGSPTTANVNETVTVTWTNNGGSSLVIEDESTSDGTVAETLGSSCGTIASKASCTSRKIKCLKAGESTITAVDTPSVEGKFVIKCD